MNTNNFLLVILVVSCLGYFKYAETEQKKAELLAYHESQDNELWNMAKKSNTIDAYQEYIDQTINGKYVEKANEAIEQIEEQIRLIEEQEIVINNYLEQLVSIGDDIIKTQYDDGINKNTIITSYSYQPSSFGSNKFIARVNLSWNGNFTASNYYSAQGIITLDESTDTYQWSPKAMSQSLVGYIDNKNAFGLTLGVLDQLVNNN
jgi:hypothetical protein